MIQNFKDINEQSTRRRLIGTSIVGSTLTVWVVFQGKRSKYVEVPRFSACLI